MAWFITGDRSALSLVVSKTGSFNAHAEARHEFRPAILADDVEDKDLARIADARCSWSLYSAEDGVEDLSLLGGDDVLARLGTMRNVSNVILTYFPDRPSMVAASVIAPRAHLAKIETFLAQVVTHDDLEYTMTLDFHGFRAPHATTDTPTMKEWLGATILAPKPALTTLSSFRITTKRPA